jgi:hypothetical protein
MKKTIKGPRGYPKDITPERMFRKITRSIFELWNKVQNNLKKSIFKLSTSSQKLTTRMPEFSLNFFVGNSSEEIMQFMPGDSTILTDDHITLDLFHVSFIVYDLEEEKYY